MEHEVQPLSIDGLSVGYGSRQVLNNLRLQIAKGEIFGLLGPNGAGKTTLIRTICGRLKPQAGAVAVGGSRGKDRVRRLGLAPQELALYSHLTIRENLEVFGCLSGIRRRDLCERLDWASKASQVAERLDERVEHLSGGWKRRVNIAAAILHLPALLILDEPTAGVDIEARSQTAITVERMAGGFTIDQKVRLDASLRAVAEKDARVVDSTPLVITEELRVRRASTATIAYYAGAVSILFLLFSSLQGAATLIEERHAGILDRIAVGSSGSDVVVLGKFLFLTVQGIIQVALIFLVAALLHDLDVARHFGAWLAITIVAAAAAAGIGLAAASACTSKQQAQTISTFVLLVSSALGGSMVPRFMMPPWLQDIGWYTPNAWAIEAYYGILWRDEPARELLPELSLLGVVALLALGTSIVVSRWRLSL